MSARCSTRRREVTLDDARLPHPAGSSRLGRGDRELSECRMFVRQSRKGLGGPRSPETSTWNCGRGWRFAASPGCRGEVVVQFGEVVSHQDQPPLGPDRRSASSVKPVDVSVVLGVGKHRLNRLFALAVEL